MKKTIKLFWGSEDKCNNYRIIIISLLCTICFGLLFNNSFSLLMLLFCVFVFLITKYVYENRSKSLLPAGVAAAFLALFTVLGTLAKPNVEGTAVQFLGINIFKELFLILGAWLFFFFLISALFILMSRNEIVCHQNKTLLPQLSSWKRILIFTAIIFICYLPYLIAFYPGIVSNDSFNQIEQVLGIRDYVSLHPIAHTFLIWVCFKIAHFFQLGNNAGCAIYSILQMFFMSGVFAYLTNYLIKKGCPKWMSVTALVFFALFPLNGFYAITMWKDFIFACFVVLLVPIINEIVQSKGQWFNNKYNLLYLGVVILGIGVMRSNAIIVVLILVPLLVIFIKKNRIKYAIVAISCVAMLGVYQYVVLPKFNIKNSSSTEMMAIPISQVCRVAALGRDLTDEQEQFITNLVGPNVATVYNPGIFDDVKFNPDYDEQFFEHNGRQFLKIWSSLAFKYPLDFIEAHLCSSLGYWYPDIEYEITDAYVHKNQEGIYEAYPIPAFSNFMRQYIKPEAYYYNSFLRSFVTPAYAGWIIIILIAYCFYKRRKDLLTVFFPVVAIWITVIFSAPCNHITRYVYTMFIALPLLVFICVRKKDNTEYLQEEDI